MGWHRCCRTRESQCRGPVAWNPTGLDRQWAAHRKLMGGGAPNIWQWGCPARLGDPAGRCRCSVEQGAAAYSCTADPGVMAVTAAQLDQQEVRRSRNDLSCTGKIPPSGLVRSPGCRTREVQPVATRVRGLCSHCTVFALL